MRRYVLAVVDVLRTLDTSSRNTCKTCYISSQYSATQLRLASKIGVKRGVSARDFDTNGKTISGLYFGAFEILQGTV